MTRKPMPKRRKRAILGPRYVDDMHRYLGRPETHLISENGTIAVWIKPSYVNNVWLQQAVGRFKSFGIEITTGWWNPDTKTFEE